MKNNTCMAYIARHPFLPGAMAYLNAEKIEQGEDTNIIERWLEEGATVVKVPLDQALHEMNIHATARQAPPAGDLPVFLRKQAD